MTPSFFGTDSPTSPWALSESALSPASEGQQNLRDSSYHSPSSSYGLVPPTEATSLSTSPGTAPSLDHKMSHASLEQEHQAPSPFAGQQTQQPQGHQAQAPQQNNHAAWPSAILHDPSALQALLSSSLAGTPASSAFAAPPAAPGTAYPWPQTLHPQEQTTASPYPFPHPAYFPGTSASASQQQAALTAFQLQQQLAAMAGGPAAAAAAFAAHLQHYTALTSAQSSHPASPQSSVSGGRPPPTHHPFFNPPSGVASAANTPSPADSSQSGPSNTSNRSHPGPSMSSLRPPLESIQSSSTLVPQAPPASTSSRQQQQKRQQENSQQGRKQSISAGIDFKALEKGVIRDPSTREQTPDVAAVLKHDALADKARSPAPSSPGFGGAGDESFDDIQDNDPLATQMWKFFAKAKQSSKMPHAARMENLSWRMGGMKLGQITAEKTSSPLASTAPSKSATASTSAQTQNQQQEQEDAEPTRGRKARSARSATPPASRAFSPIAEASNEMDWRPMSRSRSRARPPVSLPYLETNFASMPEESHESLEQPASATHAGTGEDPNDFFASLFGFPSGTSTTKDAEELLPTSNGHHNSTTTGGTGSVAPSSLTSFEPLNSNFVVDSTNINTWLNPTPSSMNSSTVKQSPGNGFDNNDWARFLQAAPEGASPHSGDQGQHNHSGTSRSGSVMGLQHANSRAENQTSDFGVLPKLVRKTSFDAAYPAALNKAGPSSQRPSTAQRQDGFVVPVRFITHTHDRWLLLTRCCVFRVRCQQTLRRVPVTLVLLPSISQPWLGPLQLRTPANNRATSQPHRTRRLCPVLNQSRSKLAAVWARPTCILRSHHCQTRRCSTTMRTTATAISTSPTWATPSALSWILHCSSLELLLLLLCSRPTRRIRGQCHLTVAKPAPKMETRRDLPLPGPFRLHFSLMHPR